MKPQQNQDLEQKIENIPTDFDMGKKGQTTIPPTTVKKLDLKPGDFLRIEVYKFYDEKKLVNSLAHHISFIGIVREKYQLTISHDVRKLLDIKENYILEVGVCKLEPYKYK